MKIGTIQDTLHCYGYDLSFGKSLYNVGGGGRLMVVAEEN